jgi:hypothetical protein
MCWARPHEPAAGAAYGGVLACSDCWDEAGPQITAQWCAHIWTRRRKRAIARQQVAAAVTPRAEPAPPPATAALSTAPAPHTDASVAPPPVAVVRAVRLLITPGTTPRSGGPAVPNTSAESWRAPLLRHSAR